MSDRLADLVRQARLLDADIKELQERRAAIVEQIADAVEPGWKLSVDGVAAYCAPPRRSFSMGKALSMLDEAMRDKCITVSYDPKLVRAAAEHAGIVDACMEAPEAGRASVRLS